MSENPYRAPGEVLVEVRVFGRTDVGRVREHNEDNFLIADLTTKLRSVKPEVRSHTVGPSGSLFAVCDGMGGAAAGEVASQMAADTIHELMQTNPATSKDEFAQRINAAISEAGARIYLAAKSNRAQRGMGTTSTVAGVFGTTLFLGQVGDSRGYFLRNGKLKQITKDQSLVWKLIEAGQLTEAEAETYEHSHIILQALGTSDTVQVDLSYVDLRQGDVLLLCSDGLSGMVNADGIFGVLSTTEDPVDACRKLTDLANENGGHDNVTVIVARFGGGLPPPQESELVAYQAYVPGFKPQADVGIPIPSKIKGADVPPPGRDVKSAQSLPPPAPLPSQRPPAPAPAAVNAGGASSSNAAQAFSGNTESVELPISPAPRRAMGVVFLLVAAGVLLTVVWLVLRSRGHS